MTGTRWDAEARAEPETAHWMRNLIVCLVGSFTTIVAMTLLLPFLPLYVEELGVSDKAAIVQWSGIAYGATFFAAAFVAPLWGRLGDIYGRKLMLVRTSLGMTVAISLMCVAGNVWQLVAAQTPKHRSAWALGTLSAGAFTTIIASLFGRFMWHGNEARKGRRKFFGIELFWELPVALGMAVIGESAAAYADLGQPASTGLIALLAYLGPRGVEALFHKWFDRRMAG